MNENDFKQKQQNAIEQMRQMNRRSNNAIHEEESNPNPPKPPKEKPQNSLLGNLGLPFLDNLKTDGDLTLILGILLLLLSEKADKRLLFALIYILF